MKIFIVLLSTVFAIILLLFLISFIIFRVIFVSPLQNDCDEEKPDPLMGDEFFKNAKRIEEGKAKLLKRKGEHICVVTDDGFKLYGEFYINPVPTENTVLCVHGYNSDAYGDFGVIANSLLNKGYNCLLLNHRHHAGSEGKYIGFGVLDSIDLIKWIEKINEKYPDGKIILYGISMGAATVMQASNKYLSDNVVGIVEDCGFTTAWDEFKFVMKNSYHLPAFPVLNILNLYARLFIGFDLRESDSRKCIAETELPVLFIHGDADAFVPCFMAEECYAACNSRKEKYICSGAAHAQSYYKHTEEYEKTLYSFLKSCLK